MLNQDEIESIISLLQENTTQKITISNLNQLTTESIGLDSLSLLQLSIDLEALNYDLDVESSAIANLTLDKLIEKIKKK